MIYCGCKKEDIFSFLLFLSVNVYSFFIFKIFIRVQLIYNVVLVSAVQQSESVIHIHISTLFQILFPYGSLQSIEQSSLCSTAGLYQLTILYIVVCICQSQPPNLSFPLPFPAGNHKFVFYICESVSFLLYSVVCCIFQISHISNIKQYLSFPV